MCLHVLSHWISPSTSYCFHTLFIPLCTIICHQNRVQMNFYGTDVTWTCGDTGTSDDLRHTYISERKVKHAWLVINCLSKGETGLLRAPLYLMDNNCSPCSDLCNIRSQMDAVYVLINMAKRFSNCTNDMWWS
jgi:hypothetical protein